MHRTVGRVTQLFAILASAARAVAAQKTEEPKSLFNGKDLSGWDGDAAFWSVEEGTIVGRTTAEKPAKHNTFLIWKDGTVRDFELRLKYRIGAAGNSGVQYRSKDMGDHIVSGYQADIDATNKYTGILYEEKGRGIIAERGQKVVIGQDGKKEVAGLVGEPGGIGNAVKKADWNDYVITARGNHITQSINGVTTVDVTDKETAKAAAEGILALQIHTGPAMTVQFKEITLTELK
jgi:hypothetical protein